jgi:hypothetical protein
MDDLAAVGISEWTFRYAAELPLPKLVDLFPDTISVRLDLELTVFVIFGGHETDDDAEA